MTDDAPEPGQDQQEQHQPGQDGPEQDQPEQDGPEQDQPEQDGPERDGGRDHAEPRRRRPYDQRELRRPDSLVVVNTGHGKGKSSAAFGTVLRGVARDWPVAVVQFLKSGKWHTGEEQVCRRLGVAWFSAGDGFSWDSRDLDESRAKAVAAWAFSRELIAAGEYRMVVLDEVSYPMSWGWIDADEVAAALRDRPRHVTVLLTGREMAEPVVEVADTVTEMVKVKHAFDSGLRALKGVDF